jgi:hypothetical protein
LETPYADSRQGIIRLDGERRFIHRSIFRETRDGIEGPSSSRRSRRDGLGYSLRHDTEDTPERPRSRRVEVTRLNHQTLVAHKKEREIV